jgi:hypothetical protein
VRGSVPGMIPFDEATAVETIAPGRYRGEVSPGWTIGPKPNGGYLLAMLGRAVAASSPHPDPVAVSAHFLWAPDPGTVTIEVGLLRAGRSASQLRAELRQEERVCVAALFTQGQLGEEPVHWDQGAPRAPEVPFEACVPSSGTNPSGVRVALMDQVEVRLDPACTAFARGEPSGRGVVEGWLALRDERPFDPLSLLFALDAFPPASFDIARTGWVPTLELTCYLRARPAPGPLRLRQAAQLVAGERFDETCTAWDRSGRLVGQATQLAGIRFGS